MAQNDDEVEEFLSLTNCEKKVARKYLKRNNWNLSYALNEYYDKEIGDFTIVTQTVCYPEELVDLFEKYSSDDRTKLEVDGFMDLINDLGHTLEEPVTLCLANLMHCKTLSVPIEKEQFLSSWFEQGCSNLSHMQMVLKDLDDDLHKDYTYFTRIYKYAFELILDEGEKTITSETAIEYWNLFFDPQYLVHVQPSQLESWYQFIKEERKEHITKDCWDMILLFFKKYSTLGELANNYNQHDPWPYIIDEYYEYLEDNKRI